MIGFDLSPRPPQEQKTNTADTAKRQLVPQKRAEHRPTFEEVMAGCGRFGAFLSYAGSHYQRGFDTTLEHLDKTDPTKSDRET